MKLSNFKVLTFDCYGTLIDWESGLYTALGPLLARTRSGLSNDRTRSGLSNDRTRSGLERDRTRSGLDRNNVLEAFANHEVRQQALTPSLPYADVLTQVHGQLAQHWGVARDKAEDTRFGQSIGDWPAFPDTVEALRYLKQHFRLVILSNVDRASFHLTNQRLGVTFDAVYTAQDVGSYKPDPRNFAYLLARLREQGITPDVVLHVAQSLFHDHVPANAAGLASAWINRRGSSGGWGATAPVSADVHYDFRFPSLGALADAHRAGL